MYTGYPSMYLNHKRLMKRGWKEDIREVPGHIGGPPLESIDVKISGEVRPCIDPRAVACHAAASPARAAPVAVVVVDRAIFSQKPIYKMYEIG